MVKATVVLVLELGDARYIEYRGYPWLRHGD